LARANAYRVPHKNQESAAPTAVAMGAQCERCGEDREPNSEDQVTREDQCTQIDRPIEDEDEEVWPLKEAEGLAEEEEVVEVTQEDKGTQVEWYNENVMYPRGIEDNCADVTVHVMVHWEVLHPLDFIGSVVDFMDKTKSMDHVRFYGFARPITHSNESDFLSTGVCWEGYSDAQSFLSHLGGGAQEPIAEILKVRKRVVHGHHNKHQLIHSYTNTQNETHETKDAAAAAIEKVEVIGPSAQLAELKEKQPGIPWEFWSTDKYGAHFSPAAYPSSEVEFPLDLSASLILKWKVTSDQFYSEFVPAFFLHYKTAPSIKRYLIAESGLQGAGGEGEEATAAGGATVMSFVSYSSVSALEEQWPQTLELIRKAGKFAERVSCVVHGPSTYIHRFLTVKADILNSLSNMTLWGALRGGYHCPNAMHPEVKPCTKSVSTLATTNEGRQRANDATLEKQRSLKKTTYVKNDGIERLVVA